MPVQTYNAGERNNAIPVKDDYLCVSSGLLLVPPAAYKGEQ